MENTNLLHKVKNTIRNAVKRAINKVFEDKQDILREEIIVEVPREKIHGDFATNIAMKLSGLLKMSPRQIAEDIVKNIEDDIFEKVEIAGPGFINFYLKRSWVYEIVPMIHELDKNYGKSEIGENTKVQVEFVSANPTGPMHMGNARGGAVGDTIAGVLEASGYDVTREFYINDAGNQIEKFADSLEIRYEQLMGKDIELPEEAYQGEDILKRAEEFRNETCGKYDEADVELRKRELCKFSLEKNINKLKEDLTAYGINYDVWFSEQSLYDSGKVWKTIDDLKSNNAVYEKEGALWFKASNYGAPKDEVLVRSNGIPTYLASDIAYHKDKFLNRGFDRVITVLGADHHGHMARMHAAMRALGIDEKRLTFVIIQLVRLVRGNEVVRMSKRTGKAISLIDLIDEVGKDAARFFFTMRSPDSQMEFDLDLAIEKSNDNPVYYVQYAYARICSMENLLKSEGIDIDLSEIDYSLLKEDIEWDIMRKLVDYPGEVELAAINLEPQRITRYLLNLAGLFHTFYNSCRVKGEEEKLMNARLSLAHAVKIVISNGLDILKINSPEHM